MRFIAYKLKIGYVNAKFYSSKICKVKYVK